MDNSDQQNTTGTPLDITQTENTFTETTVTEVATSPSIPVIPQVQQVTQETQPLVNIVTPPTSTVQTTITSPAPPSMVAPIVTPMGLSTPSQESPIAQQTLTVSSETTPNTPSPTVIGSSESMVPTPISAPTETVVTESITSEDQLTPKKKGTPPIIMGLLAVMFIGIAGGGLFAVSRAISSQQAIAPTAPISEPAAFESTDSATPQSNDDFARQHVDVVLPMPPSGIAVDDDSIDCSTLPNTAAHRGECFAVATDEQGTLYWIFQTGN